MCEAWGKWSNLDFNVQNLRIDFQFDRAAFDFKRLPVKIPYPVPFKLLGDETKVLTAACFYPWTHRVLVMMHWRGGNLCLWRGIPTEVWSVACCFFTGLDRHNLPIRGWKISVDQGEQGHSLCTHSQWLMTRHPRIWQHFSADCFWKYKRAWQMMMLSCYRSFARPANFQYTRLRWWGVESWLISYINTQLLNVHSWSV